VATVPRRFLALADAVLAHRDPRRHALLYRLLWRIAQGARSLLDDVTDDDILLARGWAKAVQRDVHKMKAFLRFREVPGIEGDPPAWVAWFEPEQRIVERAAPFFVRRFASMRWSILTPDRSAHWDGEQLLFGAGATRGQAPAGDGLDDLWRDYYASTFNPARLKVAAMTREMPKRYWKNLPEARLIPGLVRDAAARSEGMVDKAPTTPRRRSAPPAPAAVAGPAAQPATLDALRAQARDCRRCDLWRPATQVVFGEGPADARIMLVGEQPGDREDLAGRPFIGPAGELLDRALAEAGLERQRLYVTNAVKHFRFVARGKRRLHQRADTTEQAACRHWLDSELATIDPPVVVALGAMAAQALFGPRFALTKGRGRWLATLDGRRGFATWHPAYVLRLPADATREAAFRELAADLALLRDAAH
jgi:uracil-DNA glycosylase